MAVLGTNSRIELFSAAMLSTLFVVTTGCGLVGEPSYRRPAPMDEDAGVAKDGTATVDGPLALSDGSIDGSVNADVPFDGVEDVPDPIVEDVPDDAPLACPPGTTRCGESCVNLQDNPEHCGRCNMGCARAQNGTQDCRAGACVLRCNLGYGNCNSNAVDGCEIRLNGVTDCGNCRVECQQPRVYCAGELGSETCQLGCGPDQTMCLARCVSLQNDPANCGGCGNLCPAGPHQQPVCSLGRCATICDSGYRDCNGAAMDGCEVQITSSLAHCGGCGMRCGGPNEIGTCANGICSRVCVRGFSDCNGVRADGCEIESHFDVRNCGRCANSCPSNVLQNPACAYGVCRNCAATATFCPRARNLGGAAGCCTGLLADCTSMFSLCRPL